MCKWYVCTPITHTHTNIHKYTHTPYSLIRLTYSHITHTYVCKGCLLGGVCVCVCVVWIMCVWEWCVCTHIYIHTPHSLTRLTYTHITHTHVHVCVLASVCVCACFICVCGQMFVRVCLCLCVFERGVCLRCVSLYVCVVCLRMLYVSASVCVWVGVWANVCPSLYGGECVRRACFMCVWVNFCPSVYMCRYGRAKLTYYLTSFTYSLIRVFSKLVWRLIIFWMYYNLLFVSKICITLLIGFSDLNF